MLYLPNFLLRYAKLFYRTNYVLQHYIFRHSGNFFIAACMSGQCFVSLGMDGATSAQKGSTGVPLFAIMLHMTVHQTTQNRYECKTLSMFMSRWHMGERK